MWQLLWPALFGLFAGLIGTGYQAHLQRKERVEDRIERRRELKREKAEIALNETSELVKAYSDLSLDALRYASGKVETPLKPASNAKISALLLVYFPDCVPLLDELDKDMLAIVEKFGQELREGDAYKDPDKVKGVMLLLAFESSQRTRKFADDLRPRLKEEIQKLW